jgi:hypothetical protein
MHSQNYKLTPAPSKIAKQFPPLLMFEKHHDDDFVDFGPFRQKGTLLCYGLSADLAAPAVGADWAIT